MTDIIAPIEQEGTKAVVRAWLKHVGDTVAQNEPLVELETDKVAVEVPAPAAGVLAEILLDTDSEAPPGAVLGRLSSESAEHAPHPVRVERSRDTQAQGFSTSRAANGEVGAIQKKARDPELRLSPSVKRALLQHDIDPARLTGTGRDGRITRADVDRAVEAATSVESPAEAVTAAPRTIPSAGPIRSHSVPHDRMRMRIAENMLNSLTTAPHVTAVFEADFSAIIAHRTANKDAFARAGAKLTYTAYIVAAAAEAMKTAPAINSRWHDDRLEIFDDVNIGIGTALGDKGLIVPVLRKVQQLSLKGIAAGLDGLIEKARAQKLSSADVKNGTFTISNHGVSGSLFASPIIIAQPQSAILGIGKLQKRVVVTEVAGLDAMQIRPMAYVSLTIDHRVVDGHQTNAWLSRFVEVLEGWPAD